MTTSAGKLPTTGAPHVVAIVLFDGIVLGDVAAPAELFSRVVLDDGGRPYDVRLCSAPRQVATGLCRVQPPHRLGVLREAHTVIVPGIEQPHTPVPPRVLRALREAADRGARVASICTGAFVLAEAGLLQGRRATTHWRAAAELARRHPGVQVDPDVLYVDHGALLTAAGATAGLDLCLHLIRRDHGAAVAARTARLAVMPLERDGGQAQYVEHVLPASPGSLQPLLGWIDAHLAHDLSLPMLARQAATSVRTLHRRFAEQTGMTPAAWLLRARVRRAQTLLESTRVAVDEVGRRVGFVSPSAFRERFRAVAGTSPSAYRQRFRSRAG